MARIPSITLILWVVFTCGCSHETPHEGTLLLQVAAARSHVVTRESMDAILGMPSNQCFLSKIDDANGPVDKASLLGIQSSLTNTSSSCNWDPTRVEDLTKHYNSIFAKAELNRNAASHLWAHFILKQSSCLSHEQIKLMFAGFCAVSGSPLGAPSAQNRFRQDLKLVNGGTKIGYSYHCCWPCFCDEKNHIKVDTKTVKDKDGKESKYFFEVIGDPCKNNPKACSSEGEAGCIPKEAPGVKCENGKLTDATLSDSGHPIIGMFFTDKAGIGASKGGDENHGGLGSLNDACSERSKSGMQSGMGTIFVNVAKLNPLP